MNRILVILSLALCAMTVSCTTEIIEEQTPVQSDTLEDNLAKAVFMPLSLQVASEEDGYEAGKPVTKAPVQVEDFWFIEFDNSGNLLIPPVYYTESDKIAIVLPDSGSDIEYTAYVISATQGVGDNSLFTLENCATEEDFMKLHHRHDDGLADDSNGVPNLGLYGEVTVGEQTGSEGQPLACTLRRNVAKLNFTLANGSMVPSFRILAVHLGNVPREFYHAVEEEPVEYVDYFVDLKDNPIEPNEASTTYTFYVPRNVKEPKAGHEAATVKTKNDYADPRATYVEVIAADNNNTYYITFYPGANMIDDFHVEENHVYNLNINIKTYGSLTDSRIKKLRRILFEPANSYIVNPVEEEGFGFYVYGIPLKWMHRYWNSTNGYAPSASRLDFTADTNKKLVADVIWQEQNDRVIYLCDEHGIAVDDMVAFELDEANENKGYLYFRTDGKLEGNVLVGAKRANEADRMDVYLWSWHLWVTGYNPDKRDDATWSGSQYTYPVENGSIHRYSGTTWANTYTNVYIMDRNLGAMSATRTDGLAKTGGLYYQHGRKDPFPPLYEGYSLYGIDGRSDVKYDAYEGDVIRKVTTWTTLENAIKRPYTFYTGGRYNADQASDWYSPNNIGVYTLKNYPWYNPAGNVYTKSIYDPCPPGWKVPQSGIWSDIKKVSDDIQLSDPAAFTGSLAGYDFYISTQGNTDTAFYPAAGYRAGGSTNNGDMVGYGEVGRIRTSNAEGGSWDYFNSILMTFDSSSFSTAATQTHSRANACSVRCIQE